VLLHVGEHGVNVSVSEHHHCAGAHEVLTVQCIYTVICKLGLVDKAVQHNAQMSQYTAMLLWPVHVY
jgi:hypothetical protein